MSGFFVGPSRRLHVICPYCGADNDKVIDSRPADNGGSVRRRRECLDCDRRFTTYERAEKTARLMVVKRDGARVPFDPQSVLRGVIAACGKRAISEDVKVEIVKEIDDNLHRDFEREVSSAEIGQRVADRLRRLDPVVYIRFASEYYGYQTPEDLAQALEEIINRPREYTHQQALFPENAAAVRVKSKSVAASNGPATNGPAPGGG